RDDQMAPILRIDPFHLAWRRARALEKVAREVGNGGRPAPLGEVRMALEALPRDAWGLPGAGPPALPAPGPAAGAALVPAAAAPAGWRGSTRSPPSRRRCAPRWRSSGARWRPRRCARWSGRGAAAARSRAR